MGGSCGPCKPFVHQVNVSKGMFFGCIFLEKYSRPAARHMLGFARYMARAELECACSLLLLARRLYICPHVLDCKKKKIGTKQDNVKLCSGMSGGVCSGKDVCMWKAWMCTEKDAPWARQVLDRISSRASHRGADLTRHKSRESKQRGWTKSRKGRSGFMRLINVVMVWAQRHSFKKKKWAYSTHDL